MTKKIKKESHNALKVGGVLIGLAAVATAILYGTKEGAIKRKAIKGWMLKAKGEILENLEDLKHVSEDKYHEAVEKVIKKYGKISKIQASDLKNFADSMKKEWKELHKKVSSRK